MASPAFAQYPSNNGLFEVSAREACVGATISITNPCDNCEDYDFDNDGDADGTFFEYTRTGTFTVEALAAGGNVTDQVTVTIYADTIPQFNVYRCGGRTVEVKINDDNYDSYRIDWGDGNQNILSGTDTEELHTYASTGNKNISVTGLYDLGPVSGSGNCTPNEQTVAVDDVLPVATISQIYPPNNQSDRVVIKYSAPPNALYKLQLAINNSTNWIPAQDILPSNDSIVVTNLLLDENFYCFRIATLDACQQGNPPATFSSELCTQDLDVTFTDNEENILSWRTSSTTGTDFTIIIDEEGSLLTPTFSISRRSYTHSEIMCNLDYCYTLRTNYPGGATVTSLKKCGTAKLVTTRPAVTDLVSRVAGSEISLNWTDAPDTDSFESYNLFRSSNGGSFNVVATDLTMSEYVDTGLTPASTQYCYQVNYVDRCGNISVRSRDFCVIFLSAQSANLEIVELHWNPYNGYTDGVAEYRVEKFDADDNLLASFTTTDNQYIDELNISDPQELNYRVTAIPNDGTFQSSVSNILSVTRKVVLNVPNAFTPGSGGENNTFRIVTPFLEDLDMKIFNRWGELIYHSTNPDSGWPGTDQNGNSLPQDTYIYSAKLIFESGATSDITGTVFLLRR